MPQRCNIHTQKQVKESTRTVLENPTKYWQRGKREVRRYSAQFWLCMCLLTARVGAGEAEELKP